MEIDFPLEFIVPGTPLSSQSTRAAAKSQWKQRIRNSSQASLPQPHLVSDARMAVTLYYFPGRVMQGDIDNIVKLVLDALCQHVYIDDHQVERVVVQKFEPGRIFSFNRPSSMLATAVALDEPVLFVRVSDDPFAELT